jgi:anti-sigma B factor antagonist
MKVTVRQRGNVTILDLKGKLTIGTELEFRNALLDALNSGAQRIVINLRDVTTIDSSGVGELVSGYTTAVNRGAGMKLAELPPRVAEILTITQLITVFDVYGSEDEALRSFA